MLRLRTIRLAVGITAALLALPSSALAAGTLTDVSGLDYDGDAGVNSIVVDEAAQGGGTRVTVTETGINAAGTCVDNGNTATCDVSDGDTFDIELGAGNDVVVVNGGRLEHIIDGAEDDDTITGSDAALEDFIDGGPGRDSLFARGGSDTIVADDGDGDTHDGGAGDDELQVSDGDGAGDVHRGGPGFDQLDMSSSSTPETGFVVNLAAGTLTEAGGGQADTVDGVEALDGSEGNDVFVGTLGSNELAAEEGNDQIDGLAGGDLLDGEEGDDAIQARDGVNDRVFGDIGADTCVLDQFDEQQDCENVQLASVLPFGTTVADQAGPRCRTSGLKSRVRRRALARGIRFTVICNEGGILNAQMIGRVRRLPKGVRFSTVGDVVLGAARRRLSTSNQARVRLRASRRLRKSVRRRSRLRIDIAATDRFGNQRTLTKRVRLR